MGMIQVKVTDSMESEMEDYLEESGRYLNRSEMIRDAIRHQIQNDLSSDRIQPAVENQQQYDHWKAFEAFAEQATDNHGESIHTLILYGSVARGEHGANSDVDIYVVLDGPNEQEEKQAADYLRDIAFTLTVEHGVKLAPMIDRYDEYVRKKEEQTRFIRSVQEDGFRYL